MRLRQRGIYQYLSDTFHHIPIPMPNSPLVSELQSAKDSGDVSNGLSFKEEELAGEIAHSRIAHIS